MKSRDLRDLDTHRNLYKHLRVKQKGVYGFQRDEASIETRSLCQHNCDILV